MTGDSDDDTQCLLLQSLTTHSWWMTSSRQSCSVWRYRQVS